jgi:hypothetical protein
MSDSKSIEQFIKELKAIRIKDFEAVGDFQLIVAEKVEGVNEKEPEFSKAIPLIFDLFERFPEHDFDAPGPLVLMVEAHGNYEEDLLASIKRMPATMTFVLLHRLLISELPAKQKEIYTKAFLSILTNPKTQKPVIKLLEDWVNYLIDEDKINEELFKEYQSKKPVTKVKSIKVFIQELNSITEKDPKLLSRNIKKHYPRCKKR